MKPQEKWTSGRNLVLACCAVPLLLLATGCEPDTGTGADAGMDAGMDAGTDAGTTVTCADTVHDPKLGTLKLQAGFTASESAPLPEGIVAVSALPGSSGAHSMYGVRGTDDALYALGTWPQLALGTDKLFDVRAPEDRGGTTFFNGYLVNDGTRLLSGYTRSGAGFPGALALYDTVTPASSTYVSAPGNYSAAAVSGAFLINGLGLGDLTSSDTALYALKTEQAPFQSARLATFSASPAYSGPTAVTTEGIAVIGYSDSSFASHLLAAPASVYSPALTDGATFSFEGATEAYSGNDLFSATSFGTGIALHRGTYEPPDYAATTRDIAHIELTPPQQGAEQKVTAGTPIPVLVRADACTQVVLMAPMGSDLLVGVSDKNGRRLVRLQKQ